MVEKLRSKEKTTQRNRKYHHRERGARKENNRKGNETPASKNLFEMAKTQEAALNHQKRYPQIGSNGNQLQGADRDRKRRDKKKTVLHEGLLGTRQTAISRLPHQARKYKQERRHPHQQGAQPVPSQNKQATDTSERNVSKGKLQTH